MTNFSIPDPMSSSIPNSAINPTLVLGSSSPFRKEVLSSLLVNFKTCSPEIDETPLNDETPIKLVERLAIEKAKEVGKQFTNALIIGSDQVALHGAKIVGKPHTHEVAVEQLKEASGKKIELFTGLALLDTRTGELQHEVVPFTVHFKTLSDNVIERYLRKEQPYNCAGSVRSEGLGVSLFERFDGDDPNALIGLPLIRLVYMLERQGFDLYS